MSSSRNLENLTGKKFNRLSVLSLNGSKNSQRIWKCVCDCGNTIVVATKSLKSNNTKSCGCLQKEHISNLRKLEPGISSFNKIYKTYVSGAEKRNLVFDLDEISFRKITKQNCFYCGVKPMQIAYANKISNGTYLYNGIDRVNNDIGYTLSNVVPCCKHCNTMKMQLSIDDFLERVSRIYERLIKNG